MIFPSNAHTHSTFCDGISTLEEMVSMAEQKQFVSLGFTGHAGQGFDEAYSMMSGRQEAYFEGIKALQKKTSLKLYAGLELDIKAYPEWIKKAEETAEYIIASNHYAVEVDENGVSIAYDGEPIALKNYVNKHKDGDGLSLANQYFQEVVDAVLKLKPDIIGHFDLIRKHAKPLNLFDENDIAYKKLASEMLEKLGKSGAILEVNTGGMARGYLNLPYPTYELLAQWKEMGGEITLTSDCHLAKNLTFAFEEVLSQIKKLGYKQVLYLGNGNSLWESYSL